MKKDFSVRGAYTKQNPATAEDESKNGYLSDDKLFDKYSNLIKQALNNTNIWRQKQEAWHKQRMRHKKKKIFPFSDCSNLKMPTDERHLRKKKSKLINRVFGIRPIVQAVPPPSVKDHTIAYKIEKFLDHLIMERMQFYPTAVIAVDKMLEKGFQPLKAYWRVETTKREEILDLKDLSLQEVSFLFSHNTTPDQVKEEIIKRFSVDMSDVVADDNEKEVERAIVEMYRGAETITMQIEDVIYNAPDVCVPDAERVIAPAEAPIDPNRCEWICHELEISRRELEQRVKNGYNYKNISDITYTVDDATSSGDSVYNKTDKYKDQREGIDRYKVSGQVRLWEIYCWEKLTAEDSEPRKCVITIAPDFQKVLRRISLSSPSGKFPIFRINNELIDDRWYSPRGIPEIISDIVKEIDTQKNQKIDRQTWGNSPMYLYRVGIVNPNLKLRPFKGIPVPAGVDFNQVLQPVQNNSINADMSYRDEILQLNAETEELLGEINFTLQSQINRRQPRTKGEVDLQTAQSQVVSSLEGDVVSHGFTQLFQEIYAMWCEYGDDEYEFQYFGANPNGKPETIKISKEEIQGYKIVVKGNDTNTNPELRLQKANQVKMMVADPYAIQNGITTPVNYYQAQREILMQMELNPDIFVSPPTPPPPPPPEKVNIPFDSLTILEQAQVLERYGIKPDLNGRMEKAISERHHDTADLAQKHSSLERDIYDRTASEGDTGLPDDTGTETS